MFRLFAHALLLLAVFSFVVPEVPVLQSVVGVETAYAQKKKRRTLFDIFFKRRNTQRSPKPAFDLFGAKRRSQKTRLSSNPATLAPKVVVEKSESAAKILVIGDFIGGGLALGLARLYTANPNVVVINKSKASSGIVRDDVINWPETIPLLVEELKPAVVVSLVGMNDRQQMRTATGRVQKLTEGWTTEYNNRIDAIVKAGRANNLPFIWVGLPPVRSNNMNADYLAFNEFYRTKTEAVNGVFVDVWDGFTNAEGKFVSAGPDINGQIVRLRGSKGINMSKAGKVKLAFYVDKALKKLGIVRNLDGNQFAAFGNLDGVQGVAQPSVPEYDPVGTGKTVIISLGSPASDGGVALEGLEDFIKSEDGEKSVSYELVEKGIIDAPQSGRVDAGWGKPVADKSPEEKPQPEKTSKLENPSANTAAGVN